MDIHKNARLTPLGRERLVKMVLDGQTPKAVSEAGGVCPRTARKWVDRYEREGLAGLQDRSSRPKRLRQPTPQSVIDRIESLRRQRMTGQAIAAEVGVSAATVSRVLKRLGLNKLSALEPAEPPRRYQRHRVARIACHYGSASCRRHCTLNTCIFPMKAQIIARLATPCPRRRWHCVGKSNGWRCCAGRCRREAN
jgi:transposase